MNKAYTYRALAILTAPLLLVLLVAVYTLGGVLVFIGAGLKALAEVVMELRTVKEIVDGNHKNMKGPFRWWGNLWRGLPPFLTRPELREMERKAWDELNEKLRREKGYTEAEDE